MNIPHAPPSGIVLKIHEGTVRNGEGSLCKTCRNAHITRGVNNQYQVRCDQVTGTRLVRFEVAECNRYFSATQPTLYEMEEIAWRLVTKQAGRQIGFVNPEQFRRIQEKDGQR